MEDIRAMRKYTLMLLVTFLLVPSIALCSEFDLPKYGVTEDITCIRERAYVFIDRAGIDLKKYNFEDVQCYGIVGVNEVYFFGDRKINNQGEHVVGFMDLNVKKVSVFEKAGGQYEGTAHDFSQSIFFKSEERSVPLIFVLRTYNEQRLDDTSAGEFYLEVYGLKNDGTIERHLQKHWGGWDHIFGGAENSSKFFNRKGGVMRHNGYVVSPGTTLTTTGFVVDFEPKDGYLDVLLWKNNFVSAKPDDERNAFIKTGEEFFVMYYDKDSKTLKEPKKVKIGNSEELKKKLLWSKFAGAGHGHGFTVSE